MGPGRWVTFTEASEVYNVPLCAPKAAWALAAIHLGVFCGDYALYMYAGGSGGAFNTRDEIRDETRDETRAYEHIHMK